MQAVGCGCPVVLSLPSTLSGCVPWAWESIWIQMENMSGNQQDTKFMFRIQGKLGKV